VYVAIVVILDVFAALLTVTLANALPCRVSVASALTCERRRDDSYQVSACHV
jgi:hypothetical protein